MSIIRQVRDDLAAYNMKCVTVDTRFQAVVQMLLALEKVRGKVDISATKGDRPFVTYKWRDTDKTALIDCERTSPTELQLSTSYGKALRVTYDVTTLREITEWISAVVVSELARHGEKTF